MHVGVCHGGYSWPDKWGSNDGFKTSQDVPMRALSQVVGKRRVVVMKMDTEGNEASILASGVDIFESGQVEFLIVETKPHVWSERSISVEPLDRLRVIAKRVIFLEGGQDVKSESGWSDGNYLFEFTDKHASLAKQKSPSVC